MTNVKASRNKARAKVDENDVARILGGKRHWADVGGPEDVAHDRYEIQVKGGLRVANDTIRNGLSSAQAAAIGTGKLPVLVLVDRAGTRIRRYAVMDLETWADYEGISGNDD